MLDARKDAVARLRDRITNDEYDVDAHAVAEAIIARLMAGRAIGATGEDSV